MGDSNTGMLDPSANQGQFGFAFNDVDFSDRVLNVEIMGDSLDSRSNYDGDDVVPNRKRRRENSEKENGDETAESSESDCSVVVEVKTYHISSPILAAKSPFFYKLFKNGMRESQQRDATLRINASEEAALMDLMKFMYTDTLSATTTSDLLDVLFAADKFEVPTCMRYCSLSLQKIPMSLDSALLYLGLPANILVDEAVRPLIDAAERYLFARYWDFNKSKNEVMGFPLCALEVILGGLGLTVNSEDDVFDFILKWACEHYPKLEERQEILTKLLVRYIWFSCMSYSKLKEALVHPDFSHEEVYKRLLEALVLKGEAPYSPRFQLSKDQTPLKRVYKFRPIKVVHFEFSDELRCVVYFSLEKVLCEALSMSQITQRSESFRLGGRVCCLSAGSDKSKPFKFGLFLHMKKESENCPETFTLDCEFAARKKPSKEFQRKFKAKLDNSKFPGNKGVGTWDLLSITDFVKDSEYFIDDILHLQVNLTFNASQA